MSALGQKRTYAVQKAMSCFAPNSDRKSRHPYKVMSALPPKADMCGAPTHVCFGPKADMRRNRFLGWYNRPKANLIHPHHHAGRLDDGISGFSFFKLQIVSGFVSNRCGDHLPADVNAHMCRRGTFFNVNNLAFELIAGAEFHEICPPFISQM